MFLCWMWFYDAECFNAECHNAEMLICWMFFLMLNAVMLNIIMMNVIMLSKLERYIAVPWPAFFTVLPFLARPKKSNFAYRSGVEAFRSKKCRTGEMNGHEQNFFPRRNCLKSIFFVWALVFEIVSLRFEQFKSVQSFPIEFFWIGSKFYAPL